ncbi:hypothetical protein [Burkholderia phage vB_BglM_WTB]
MKPGLSRREGYSDIKSGICRSEAAPELNYNYA